MAKVKTIYITAKCSDLCHVLFLDKNENSIGERDDYVPNWMPGEHYGDYVKLEIDIATGHILNWDVPTQKQLTNSIESKITKIADKLNKMESYFCECDGDTRIHLDYGSDWKIDIHAPTMGKKRYTKMEKLIDKTCITKDGYEVYAWNDISGYKYWNKKGKENGWDGMNYIMITANIKDADNVDLSELKQDMEKVWNIFVEFENFSEFEDKFYM